MGLEKRFKRTEITYQEIMADNKELFVINHDKYGWSYDDAEDFQVEQSAYTFSEYEIDRMLCFISMAYFEIVGDGLSNRLKEELKLDIPVLDSGIIDGFLTEEEKEVVFEHLDVIKKYIK